jgi:3-deoxy-D-manno-octulosonate 8-phosphate phosphatase (KDO 8-P phosphatase)
MPPSSPNLPPDPIRLLVLDVDGVLTDGGLIINDRGEEAKVFYVQDGMGIKLLMKAGVEVIFLSGRKAQVVAVRGRELGVNGVFQGIRNKWEFLKGYLEEKGIAPGEVAFVGDDLVDLPLLCRVGWPVMVPEGHPDLKPCVRYVTRASGGRGAVREVCEILLKALGQWESLTQPYRTTS